MRVMVLVKASEESEAGIMPSEDILTSHADAAEAFERAVVLTKNAREREVVQARATAAREAASTRD